MTSKARRTAFLFVFFALIIPAASGAVVWGIRDDPPSFDNGSYQIRSASLFGMNSPHLSSSLTRGHMLVKVISPSLKS